MLVENRAGSERALILLIFVEIAIFAFTGPNFFSAGNAFEIVRLGVELGLLALALTPVIVTGGIDLSVGSMMGLCAVVFGYLWRDAHFPIPLAAACTLVVGIAGGGLNALVITRFKGAPLIVTLGTYSLFRGLAEGLTRGVDNFSQFPANFLYLGQGYLGGIVPSQAPVFVVFAAFYFLLLHPQHVYGRCRFRSLSGSRAAGLLDGRESRSNRRLWALIYTLSGFTSARRVKYLVYVAASGTKRVPDAGTGYELLGHHLAVVLGRVPDIMGVGRWQHLGNAAGHGAADCGAAEWAAGFGLPRRNLAGILTSAILVATIAINRFALQKTNGTC